MTGASIGIKQTDGSVRAIRLNADGYPAYAEVILVLNYNKAERIEALLQLGELSQLDKQIAPSSVAIAIFPASAGKARKVVANERKQADGNNS